MHGAFLCWQNRLSDVGLRHISVEIDDRVRHDLVRIKVVLFLVFFFNFILFIYFSVGDDCSFCFNDESGKFLVME